MREFDDEKTSWTDDDELADMNSMGAAKHRVMRARVMQLRNICLC